MGEWAKGREGEWALPDSWVWTITREVCASVRDGTHDTPKYVDQGVPLITSKNLLKTGLDFNKTKNISLQDHEKISERSGVEKRDVLFAMIGTIGNPVVVRTDRAFSIKNVGLFKKNEVAISSDYLKYWLESPGFNSILEEKEFVRGTTQRFVPLGNLRILPVPLAPPPEQRRVVAEIETQFTRLDAGVAALERVQANLRRYKAAVLKAACEGRLVPTEAELARVGAQRAAPLPYEPADQLLARILAERRARWEAAHPGKRYVEPAAPDTESLPALSGAEGPELPEGWAWAMVEQLAESIQYGHTESAKEDPVGPKFLRITDIQDGRVDWNTVPYCKCSEEEHRKYGLEPGDIVFTRTGATTGKSFLITDCPDAVFASYLIRLRIDKSVDVKYFALFLEAPIYWTQIMNVKKGSAQPGVNATILSTLRVPLPPLAEQHRIVAEVERRLSVVAVLEREVEAALARAARLRQAVLKCAFEGRLVPQDPDDEPASVLLERIRAERAQRERKSNRKEQPKQMELF